MYSIELIIFLTTLTVEMARLFYILYVPKYHLTVDNVISFQILAVE